MRIFVYEYMTATGTGRDPGSPEHGMYLEGLAMRDALTSDFARIDQIEVVALDRFEDDEHEHEIWRVADQCDWAIVIAPETAGQLERDNRAVHQSAGRLLGCSIEAAQLSSDKLALAEHWREHGVRTPATTGREPTACEGFPVVWKPRDGAGSTDTFLIRDRFEMAKANASHDSRRPMILQEFVPGHAASVAFLCGPRGQFPLLPTFQMLTDDGLFKYEGGELPIPPALAERAVMLASRAVECVPGLLGYVGVDLVLGDAEDCSRDYAIEINPRLTTSYIGLQALADFNIAEAMLNIASGDGMRRVTWKAGRIRFWPNGRIQAI